MLTLCCCTGTRLWILVRCPRGVRDGGLYISDGVGFFTGIALDLQGRHVLRFESGLALHRSRAAFVISGCLLDKIRAAIQHMQAVRQLHFHCISIDTQKTACIRQTADAHIMGA